MQLKAEQQSQRAAVAAAKEELQGRIAAVAAQTIAQQQTVLRLQRSTAVAFNDQLKELATAAGAVEPAAEQSEAAASLAAVHDRINTLAQAFRRQQEHIQVGLSLGALYVWAARMQETAATPAEGILIALPASCFPLAEDGTMSTASGGAALLKVVLMPESCCLQMLAAETNAQQQIVMRLQRSTAVACNDQLKELVTAVGHARLQVALHPPGLDPMVILPPCFQ